jgi:hypothetical protein
MRVACVLFGQPRYYETGYNNIRHFFQNQNSNVQVDFFYHCWTLNDNDTYSAAKWNYIDPSCLQYENNIPNHLLELYNPIRYEYENQSNMIFDESMYKNTLVYNQTDEFLKENINNILFQTYSRNKARNILDNYIKETNTIYDFVIMTRFDIGNLPIFDLNILDCSNTYIPNNHYPRKIIPDVFFIIPVNVFLAWFTIYDSLSDLLNNENIITKVSDFGEKLVINSEQLIFGKYLSLFENLNNICYINYNYTICNR